MALGNVVYPGPYLDSKAGEGAVVAIGGLLGACVIDASLLAYRPVPREDVSFVVLPSLRPNEVGAQFMGSF